MATLRISHLIIQTVFVLDDGAELSPGPEVAPIRLSTSQVQHFMDALPAEVAALSEKLSAQRAE